MNGLPSTGAIGLGTSGSRCWTRVPSPPARMTAVTWSAERVVPLMRSDIRVNRIAQNSEPLDQFLNAAIEAPFRFETGAGDARVGNNIIALVGILADRRFEVDEFRQMFLDDRAQFELREVRVVEPHVV